MQADTCNITPWNHFHMLSVFVGIDAGILPIFFKILEIILIKHLYFFLFKIQTQ